VYLFFRYSVIYDCGLGFMSPEQSSYTELFDQISTICTSSIYMDVSAMFAEDSKTQYLIQSVLIRDSSDRNS